MILARTFLFEAGLATTFVTDCARSATPMEVARRTPPDAAGRGTARPLIDCDMNVGSVEISTHFCWMCSERHINHVATSAAVAAQIAVVVCVRERSAIDVAVALRDPQSCRSDF
jgi:hypothetical protein